MQWLARICVQRPVFASVLILVILVLGVVGYSRLGVDQFPNIDIPIVVVTTRLDGASPEEVETDITDKIESAVNTIGGIDELNSVSSEGVSQVNIAFKLEKDTESAINDVRDKINQATKDLPKGLDPPVITKVDPSALPILLIGVRGANGQKFDIRDLTEAADKKVRRQLESINGVGRVNAIGGRDRQINILLNPLALRAESITPLDVMRTLQTQNLVTPGGSLEKGPESVTLKIDGRVSSVEQIGRLSIRDSGGRILRISDVAKVVNGKKELESIARYEGEDLVALSIVKQGGTNTIEVADAILKRLDVIQSTLPKGMELVRIRDNSQPIRTSIHGVTEHLVLGSVLAALVVLLFLGNIRSTIIAAVAIPVSVIGTFGLMYVQGYTLNILTLLALALSVGLVIDDAIVVLENIVRFIDQKGVKPFPAAVRATKDIGLAVMATTLSLMAVFIPVAFIGGLPGRMLKCFGFTMAFAIGVSLIVSFSLTPMMSARLLKTHQANFLTKIIDAFYRPIERAYLAMLSFSLKRRWVIVLACGAALGTCVPVAKSLPAGFLPEDDKAKFQVTVRAPEGTSSEETLLIAERAAVGLRKLPGVAHILITVAEDDAHTRNFSQIYVDMVDPDKRDITQLQAMERARDEVVAKMPPGLRVNVAEVPDVQIGANLQNIQIVMSGPDFGQLEKYADEITKGLRESKLAVDIDTTNLPGRPEVKVSIDRDRAADLGVSAADVATTLQMLISGVKASTYPEAGEEYDVRIRAEDKYRTDASALSLINVPSTRLVSVPLSSVVRWRDGNAPSHINRYGRERQITFLANAAPGVGEDKVVKYIQERFADMHPSANYKLQFTGASRAQADTAAGFVLALGMAFVFMYLILAAQFESWLYPMIILVALPLTAPFAFIALKLFGQGLNLFSMLGLLVLFGVVKKNAILQVDHTNHLRREGLNNFDSLMQANKDRLRPILMTTIAFVAGMLPLIVSKGIGSGFSRAVASIVIGGQTLSLLLTLLAVPVFYSLIDSLRARRSRRKAASVDRGEAELAAEPS